MSEDTGLIEAAAARLFSRLANPQDIIRSGDTRWRAPLWQAVESAGFTQAWASAETGADLEAGGFALLRAAGRSALAVPLGETMLAGWLLAKAGLELPPGMAAVAPCDPRDSITLEADGRLNGRARGVVFPREAPHIVVLAKGTTGFQVALLTAGSVHSGAGETLAGEPSPLLRFESARPLACTPVALTPVDLLTMGAAMRCQLIAGALETMLELSVRQAMERVAFERPIAKYQAIQHALARMGGEVAAAVSAACSAADALATETGGDALFLEVAAAKIRCGEAAEAASAIAHQVHGAIGFTDEHVLHRFSLRALGWRDDFGSESHWAEQLGQRIAALGADELWPLIAAR